MTDHVVGGLHCADVTDLAASFVLGALEPAEADAVRRHLADCPEAHAEFAELGSVVPALLDSVDVVQPPSALRDRILAAAAADAQAIVAAPQAADPQRAMDIPRLADTQRSSGTGAFFRRPTVWAVVGLAAALAIAALGAWNLQLRDELGGLTAYRNGVAAVIDEAARPNGQLAVLSTPDGVGGPAGLAAVSEGGARVSIVMRDLVPTSGTEVYEAWLIAGENAPVPIGSFTVSSTGIATFSTTASSPTDLPALTVALTREPQPGATTPTLPIIAAGTAS